MIARQNRVLGMASSWSIFMTDPWGSLAGSLSRASFAFTSEGYSLV